MTGSLRTRFLKGLAANTAGQAANLAIQILSVPLFLFFWGADLYGEWLILFAMPAYLALSDLGFATTAMHRMAMLVSNGKRDEALSVFQTAWTMVTAVSGAIMIAVAVAAIFMPVGDWFQLSRLGGSPAAVILILLGLQFLTTLQTSIFYAGFYCDGQYGLGSLYQTGIRVFEFALLAGAVAAGLGPEAAAAAFIAGRLIGTVAMGRQMRKNLPWLRAGYRHADWNLFREMLRPSLAFMGFPLGNALGIQGVVLVLGASLGPGAVVVFATLRTLTRVVIQATNALSISVRPEISRAYGAEDFDLLRILYRRLSQASTWIGLVSFVVLFFAGPLIMSAWTGGRIGAPNPLFLLLLAVVLVNSWWWGSLSLLYASNRHEGLSLAYIAANLAAILLVQPLAGLFGVAGAAASLLVSEIAIAIYTIVRANALIDESPAAYIGISLSPPLYLIGQIRELAAAARQRLGRGRGE